LPAVGPEACRWEHAAMGVFLYTPGGIRHTVAS
jgi:hypothetical protein